MKICVSGAAGQIAYSFLPQLCNGSIFGKDCPLDVVLFDIPPAFDTLRGVKMELEDCSFSTDIQVTTDVNVAFVDVDVAILVGGFPRKQGMLRKDLIAKNVPIFREQGMALEKYASRDVKVLVVANPANTNCLIAMEHAPSIPRENFTCLTRLDHERMRSFISRKMDHRIVRNCIIWGNHSKSQFPDCSQAEYKENQVWYSVVDKLNDQQWIQNTLVSEVQQRGAAVLAARKLSSAMSAATAIAAHLRDWYHGNSREYVSMGIVSDQNPFKVPTGLIYSFPVRCKGKWQVEYASELTIDAFQRGMMEATANELLEERKEGMDILKASL